MGGKKTTKQEQGQQREGSDSNDSQVDRKMIEFDSDRSWSELDEMERELAQGNHIVSCLEDMPQPPKKRDKLQQRQDQIAQYEEALKIAESQNTRFINPFQPYSLNIDPKQYQKMLHQVLDEGKSHQCVARLIGLKSIRNLYQERLYAEMQVVRKYLEKLEIPDWIRESHAFLKASTGNMLCKPQQ